MRAVKIVDAGPNGSLELVTDYPVPTVGAGEVLIKVAYTALNRADIFQKQGKYPPPEGASPLPGLEVSGKIVAVGKNVRQRKAGEMVCALLEGGGYSEYVAAPAGQILSIPNNMELAQAAALPEALFTIWLALFSTAKLKNGDKVLIHGGASGIGHIAIQMATAAGAQVIATAGSDKKCDFCKQQGAILAVNHKKCDFLEELHEHRFNIILDIVGGEYMQKNLRLLAQYGRIVSLAFLAGSKAEINMAYLLFKQASWHGLTLRSRTAEQKALLASQIREKCWPWLANGQLQPVVDKIFTLEQAEKAHKYMQQNLNIGKILLKVADL